MRFTKLRLSKTFIHFTEQIDIQFALPSIRRIFPFELKNIHLFSIVLDKLG